MADYLTQGYLAVVGMLILLFHGNAVKGWYWLVALHVVLICCVHLLIRANSKFDLGVALRFLRFFYPVFLYTGIYRECAAINQMFVSGYLDAHFLRLEAFLFGQQPSFALMKSFPYRGVSEILYAAYFSYYWMIFGVGVAIYWRNKRHYLHFVSVISLMLYFCCICFIFLPVVGPPIFSTPLADTEIPKELLTSVPQDFPKTVGTGVFFQVMKVIYDLFEAPGGSFPSSHVAVAIGTLTFSYRYLRGIRVLHLVLVILLCIATVYCRYHYVVDVVAGALTAAALVPVGNWLYRRFE